MEEENEPVIDETVEELLTAVREVSKRILLSESVDSLPPMASAQAQLALAALSQAASFLSMADYFRMRGD